MSDTEKNDDSSTGGAWEGTLRLLERVIFTQGIAAVGKPLLIAPSFSDPPAKS